jgi:hypothetical protein
MHDIYYILSDLFFWWISLSYVPLHPSIPSALFFTLKEHRNNSIKQLERHQRLAKLSFKRNNLF